MFKVRLACLSSERQNSIYMYIYIYIIYIYYLFFFVLIAAVCARVTSFGENQKREKVDITRLQQNETQHSKHQLIAHVKNWIGNAMTGKMMLQCTRFIQTLGDCPLGVWFDTGCF